MNADDESRLLMRRLLDQGIKPHAQRIAEIAAAGGVAVVVFEPEGSGAAVAREMGWNKYGPASQVFHMSQEHAARFAMADAVTRRWLARSSGVRVFLVNGDGTLLVNHGEDGWSLEPGSTDAELARSRS